MDVLPSGNIFQELEDIHDTGFFSAQTSMEDQWKQVGALFPFFFNFIIVCFTPVLNIFFKILFPLIDVNIASKIKVEYR